MSDPDILTQIGQCNPTIFVKGRVSLECDENIDFTCLSGTAVNHCVSRIFILEIRVPRDAFWQHFAISRPVKNPKKNNFYR